MFIAIYSFAETVCAIIIIETCKQPYKTEELQRNFKWLDQACC